MTTLSMILVILGIVIIATRSPLIVAPVRTRTVYLQLLSTNGRMRAFGIAILVMAALLAFLTFGSDLTAALVIFYASVATAIMAALALIPFPGPSVTAARRVWESFSPTVLRFIGLFATLFGLWLIFLGFGI